MERRGAERAVTIQIGAVLLLAIVVSALAVYQVNAVPQQNFETEYAHGERVAGELVELRDAIRTTGADRIDRGVPVTLGTTYQTRVATVNPPPPVGTLETSEPMPVAFENASVDDETIQEILDDPPETRILTYEPGYHEYDGPTTVIEHTLLYDAFDEGSVTLEDQAVVRDDRLTLVFVDGDLSRRSSGTVSVDVESLAGPTERTTLESDGSGNVTITLPTRDPERWEDALGTSFEDDSSEPRAWVRETTDDAVTIELADEEFELELAQVGVGRDATADERLENATADGSGSSGSDGGDDDDDGNDDGGDGGFEDGTVFGVGASQLGNNDRIEYTFDLETAEGTYSFDVHVEDTPGGGGAGGNWQVKRVVVDGNWLELTTDAADDIGVNLVRRDLLDPAAYEGGNTAILVDIRDEVDDGSQITNEQDQGGDVELIVEIDER